jgi:hypothetical protein
MYSSPMQLILQTQLSVFIKRFYLFIRSPCPSVLRTPSSVRPTKHSLTFTLLTFTQQSLLSAQLEAATTTTIILIHTPNTHHHIITSHSLTKLRCHVKCSGFTVKGSRFRVKGSRLRVQGSRLRVHG